MTDRRVIYAVTLFLGAVVLAAVIGAIALSFSDRDLPELVDRMAMVALGSLGALLANTRPNDVPTPVNVVNEPRDPVPVEAAPVKGAAKKR